MVALDDVMCCRVVFLVLRGDWVGGELKSPGVGFWLAGGGRAQGSEFLVGGRPLAGGVSAERCGGWTGLRSGREDCGTESEGQAGRGEVKTRNSPTLEKL